MKKNKLKYLIWFVFCIYIAAMVYFLFFSERYGRTEVSVYRYNLKPFSEIKRYLKYYDTIGFEGFMLNIVGNVAAFVPFGFCMPVFAKSYRNFLVTFLNGLLIITCIETIQLVFMVGSFDVDDILLNITGVILGFFAYKIAVYIRKIIRKNKGE